MCLEIELQCEPELGQLKCRVIVSVTQTLIPSQPRISNKGLIINKQSACDNCDLSTHQSSWLGLWIWWTQLWQPLWAAPRRLCLWEPHFSSALRILQVRSSITAQSVHIMATSCDFYRKDRERVIARQEFVQELSLWNDTERQIYHTPVPLPSRDLFTIWRNIIWRCLQTPALKMTGTGCESSLWAGLSWTPGVRPGTATAWATLRWSGAISTL